MVPSSHYVVPRSHVIVFLSHSVVPLFFFSHLMVLSSYCAVPISDVAVLHTSSVQVGNPCAQLFANSICSLLTASCLSFSSDPKKIQNISLFHQTFVYGWISMAIASSHQIPHHNWWCLPLWHSPRLTISLSLSLIWVSLFSPSLKPSRGRASASTHTYRHWRCLSSASQPLVAAGLALLFFIFFLLLFFSIFCLPFRQDWNPFDTHFVSFFY